MLDAAGYIKSISLFKNCSAAFFEKMSIQAIAKHYTKGQLLFIAHDQAERFYIVREGWVKLFRETLDGSQAVLDILTKGHIFAETAIFESGVYPYSAEAIEDLEVVSIPLAVLKTEIETNNQMALDMLESMSRYRRQQEQEIEHISVQNAPQRIGCFLLRLVDQNANGAVKIQLPYDKMLVASRLGMQPETFSRALNKLKEKTGAKIQGAVIEVDSIDQLVEFSCSACSSEFPCKDLQNCK